jgi:hypothetical protein
MDSKTQAKETINQEKKEMQTKACKTMVESVCLLPQ